MSVRSMTGFGQGARELQGLRLAIVLKGVNNRYSDLRLRLPAKLADLEPEIRRRILSVVRRGRVEVDISVELPTGSEPNHQLNRPLFDQVVRTADALRDDGRFEGRLDLTGVLAIPGMFRGESAEVVWEAEGREAMLDALDDAIAAFDADRRREGAVLAAELISRLAELDRHATAVGRRAAELPEALRDRLLKRLDGLRGSVELDATRVAQEAAFLAERSDLTEEIVRLEGHLGQARHLVERPDGEPLGKRLDFLLQEIHRETNTIGAKSADLELTRAALAIKLEAEKLREQVQNVE